LFRSGDNIRLDVLGWSVPAAFVDDNGYALSDHAPVAATYRWQLIPHPPSPEARRSVDSG
jgi:hypothetical protein